MLSIDPRSARWGALVLVSVAAAAPLAAATLVVRSAGPSAAQYPPGKVLAETAKIALKPNDQLVLLDARGTRTLRGPGNFSAVATAAADVPSTTALAALVDQRSDRRVRIGAVRSLGGAPSKPSGIWYVDAARPGTVCVADPAQTTVWRSTADTTGTTTIAAEAGAKSIKLDWSPGQAAQAWPASLPIADGARYRLTTGTGQPVPVRFALVGAQSPDLQATAATLISKGCSAQLDQLIETATAVTKAAGGPG